MVRVILSKQDNIKDQLEMHIDVYENITANKWIALLKKITDANEPIKKHVSCHGWIMDQSRTLKHIVDEINYTVDEVNNYNFAKAAWEEKRTDIKKDFKVDLDLTVQSLVQGKHFNTDIVNQLHDKFVQLEGAKSIDNVESIAPYFEVATPEIRWRISKLNNLAHELFHWGEEYKRWHRAGWYNPELHVHYYNTIYEEYKDEDDDSFNLRYEFGRVFIGDPTVGKLYWDAFNDAEDHIHNDELYMPTHMVPDFHMYFGSTSTQEQNKIRKTEYEKWLYDRGLLNEPSANIRIGKPWVGEINFRKTFNTAIHMDVLQNMSGYNNIYAIIVDGKKTSYEWTIQQEEIDITQHA